MAIPDFQTLMLPLLKLIGDGCDHAIRDVIEKISDMYELTEDERQEMLPSKQSRVIVNRVGWAKTYLKKAELLEQPKRGIIRLTPQGKTAVAENPERVDMKYLEKFPAYIAWGRAKVEPPEGPDTEPTPETKQTPDERIAEAYDQLRAALADSLLEMLKKCNPKFFEDVVLQLLQKMGYGWGEDAGQATGKPGDEGIDGVIDEDRLGLDSVCIQAKRWEGTVGQPVVHNFVGSMGNRHASKGAEKTGQVRY